MNSYAFNPLQAIGVAESETDPEVRLRLLEQAIGALSTQDYVHTADTHYALGYAWYLHPQVTPTRNSKVTLHLQNALDIDPGHRFARLYLGHHHYERRQFAEALAAFSSFQTDEFSALGQDWRDAKVAELLLCCTLHLGNRSRIRDAVFRFCDSLTNCEDGMNPGPDELTATLIEMSVRRSIKAWTRWPEARACLRGLASDIKKARLSLAFFTYLADYSAVGASSTSVTSGRSISST